MNDKQYSKIYSMSDKSLSEIIGLFVKHHRLQQNLSQEKVAQLANISRSTLSLLERGETVTVTTLLQVLRVLDLLYVMEAFEIHQQISPIALAKLDREKRKRASGKKSRNK